MIATDAQGRIVFVNPVAEELTGWAQGEAIGRPLEEVFVIVNEETQLPVESPVTRVLREKRVVGLANHTLLIARDGRQYPIDDSGAPIRNRTGRDSGKSFWFSETLPNAGKRNRHCGSTRPKLRRSISICRER